MKAVGQLQLPSPSVASCLKCLFVALLPVVYSAVPFLSFLLLYAINDLVRFLPTADESCIVKLYNVTALERLVVPISFNTLLSSVHCVVLDVLSAVPYLAHYTLPVTYPVVLFIFTRRDEHVRQFYLLLGLSMWVHYVIWYLFPTAPPWFYQPHTVQCTSAVDATVAHREGAAFARLDELTGVKFFHKMFAGNPVPFGAFPSGHVAWPTCVLVTMPTERRWFFSIYIMLVAWATMYASHHYLADVIGAILVVISVRCVTSRMMTSERPLPDKNSVQPDDCDCDVLIDV